MEPEIIDDEVSLDSGSSSTTRPSTAESFDMPKGNLRSTRSQTLHDLSLSTTKLLKEEKPIKVLVVNGKCSQVFKSTLEDCVEDCILEFSGEKNSVYVSKSGQVISVPIGSTRNSLSSLREPSAGGRQSSRSNRQRNSTNLYTPLPSIGSARNSLTNNFSLPSAALPINTAARMRHQLVQQRFSLAEDISEESTEQQTIIEQAPITTNNEFEGQLKRHSLLPDEPNSSNSNLKMTSSSLPLFPSVKNASFHQDRQKNYRLSDLVMYGPECFAHVFKLPRNRSSIRRRNSKITEELTELDRIKQDLFHRYLWTQKPQVSCRIRPISTYVRSSTFVT